MVIYQNAFHNLMEVGVHNQGLIGLFNNNKDAKLKLQLNAL
jgi:hypothetical protein